MPYVSREIHTNVDAPFFFAIYRCHCHSPVISISQGVAGNFTRTKHYRVRLGSRQALFPHSAAAALAWLLRRRVGVQLDLVREVVILVVLHLLR